MIIAGICLLLWFSPGIADEKKVSAIPERVVLNITETPFSSQAVTWRTRISSASPRAEILPVLDLLNPEKKPKIFPALSSTVVVDDKDKIFQHSIIFNELLPDMIYAYRVGDDQSWSEWNQFRTASEKTAPFTFLYFGDIQKDIFSMCSQVFRAAFQKEPDARFWLFTGDMVDNGLDDREWDEFFSALSFIPRTIPLVLVPGNHEYPGWQTIVPGAPRTISHLWRPQFTFPENGPKGLEEIVYSFNYQGVCFIILNGVENLPEQVAWLENVLSKNQQPWTVVAMHHPIYSVIDRRNSTELQDVFVPLFDRFSVDLVLQGHHHSYARTKKLKNNSPVSDKEKGTVYVITNSGPKYYPASNRYDHLMDKTMTHGVWFQSIRIENNTLQYTAYNMIKEVVDTVVIKNK